MPNTWQLLASAVFLAVLGTYAWRRWGVPGALPFAIGCMFGALWLLGAAAEAATSDPALKTGAHVFQALWQLPLLTAMMCFGLEYTRPAHRLTRRQLILLSLPPLLAGFLVLTNSVHQLAWTSLSFNAQGAPEEQLGIAGWILTLYGWILIPVNVVLFSSLFIRSPLHRWPVALMLGGQLIGRGLYIAAFAGVNLFPGADPFLFLLVVPYTMYAIALFGFRIFDPLPAARAAAIHQMREGMLVFDGGWRAVTLNPAAETILGAPKGSVRGKTLGQLLPALSPALMAAGGPRDGSTVISLGAGPGARDYAARISPLEDYQGMITGHVLLLLDVTESRRAQARVLEEQRTEAMIQERERLAAELHDGVGQVFATVNVLGEAVRRLLARGDVAAADKQVARLVEIAEEAHEDIRDSILGLRVTLSAEGFFAALEGYLDRFEKNYGIHVELIGAEILDEHVLNPTAEIQLMRILQEALTNVRKHSGASSVQVVFKAQNGYTQVVVRDDGRGFDARQQGALTGRVGLLVMRERAGSVGGDVSLHSAPGEGTQVIVTVPMNTPAASHGDAGG